ncbi:MAG: Rieske 2Fe-2S domain-containing protein [Candidatus Rokubacteria bacterium]|nr:Rieske 2Fe-2S domain-containing protein [Candidatus Rokubacteria bacterium]
MARVRLARVAEVGAGEGRVIAAAGTAVALFNVGGAYCAIANECPHRGGPLADGDLHGTVVTCPWHGWRWDVTTGANVNNPVLAVPCFEVSVRDGEVFAEIP